MKRKLILYHCTPAENVESIKAKGLVRYAKRSAAAIYLSEKPLSWWHEGLRILRVDISGLDNIKASTFLPESDEILFWGDIPYWKHTKNGYSPRIIDVTDKYVGGKKQRRTQNEQIY